MRTYIILILLVLLSLAGCKKSSSSAGPKDAGGSANDSATGAQKDGAAADGATSSNDKDAAVKKDGSTTGLDGGTASNDSGSNPSGSDSGSPQDAGHDAGHDAGPTMYTLTIDNYLAWCTVSVDGAATSIASTQTKKFVAGTVVPLVGDTRPNFYWGYWTNTAGDTTSAHDTSKSTTVTMTSDKTVRACCPTTNGGGC